MTPRAYSSPERFKTALLDRLKHRARELGVAPERLQVRLVLDRFLARVTRAFGDAVVLKGGLALELRLDRARATKDVDLRIGGDPADTLERLQKAGHLDLQDFMQFEVRADPHHPEITNPGVEYGGLRFEAKCLIAGKPFGGHFGVDVVFGATMVGTPERIRGPDTLDFVGVPPPEVLVYPLVTHIAEKLHAYTFPRTDNTRVKDLPDLALLGTTSTIAVEELRGAIRQIFEARATHPVPSAFPGPPGTWAESYAAMATTYALSWPTLSVVTTAARAFLQPILDGTAAHHWSPAAWRWE